MPKNTLTQERLKELLHYDPETGTFKWKVSTSRRIRVGAVAGSIQHNSYRYVRVDRELLPAHHLAFLYANGRWPLDEIDHANGIRDDNRLVNLCEASNAEQNKNLARRYDNTSTCTGVCFSNTKKKWRVTISISSKQKHLGFFDVLEDAIAARKAAEKLYGYHPNHGREPTRPQASQPTGPSLVRASQATPPLKPPRRHVRGS